jgi:hypothetical protein
MDGLEEPRAEIAAFHPLVIERRRETLLRVSEQPIELLFALYEL